MSVTIYRRHKESCKQKGHSTSKKCDCSLWLVGTLFGKPYRRTAKTRSWTAAEKIKRQLEDGEVPRPEIPNLFEAVTKFMKDAEHGRKLAKATLKKYRALLDGLKTFAGDIPPRELSVDLLRSFRNEWKDSPITSVKKMERLRAFCRFLEGSGWLERNPAKAITTPKPKDPPTLPFEDEEVAAILLHATDARWHALIQVLRWSGLRIGDAMKLTTDKLERLTTDALYPEDWRHCLRSIAGICG